jgi:uncharacterized alpha-E superfamily protein
MLSRVADSLYWMSRYLERAEHTTRLLDVNLNLMLDETSNSADHRWPRLLQSLGRPRRLKWEGNPYTLAHVREQISTEQWHRLNSLYLEVTRPGFKKEMQLDAESSTEGPVAFLQQVMEAVHQFQGVTDSTMSHGEGWHFIQVGRYLERATATTFLLEAYHEDLWAHPDRAFEAYCKVYTADLTPERILEFILLDPEFPHSVRFSIDALHAALGAIQQQSGKRRADEVQRLAGKLSASLAFASIDEILDRDVVGYLRRIQQQCNAIHNEIYELYVNYSIQTALAG